MSLFNKCEICKETIFNNNDPAKVAHTNCKHCACGEDIIHGAPHKCRTMVCDTCGMVIKFGVWHTCYEQMRLNALKESGHDRKKCGKCKAVIPANSPFQGPCVKCMGRRRVFYCRKCGATGDVDGAGHCVLCACLCK